MQRRRAQVVAVSLIAGASLSLVAAGCGGGGSAAGVAHVSTTTATSTTPANGLLAFSRCMRANGVPSFPDPQSFAGGSAKLTIHQLPSNPQMHTALSACSQLLPTHGGSEQADQKQLADELSFAKCMRSHGVARFPDPTAQGQLSVAMVEAQGIDVQSPQILHVVQTCLPASHGALTPAKVREAIANAGH